EQKMIKSALHALNSVQADQLGRRITAIGEHFAVYNERDKSLRIIDGIGDKGVLYKAQQGQTATINHFSEAEKQQFAAISLPKTTQPKLTCGER
ncbi:hypothetical protein, partial [Coleofasciculus sp. LEGE 07081]